MSEYRKGLPSIEDVQAHEARGGWWQLAYNSGGAALVYMADGGPGFLDWRMAGESANWRRISWVEARQDGRSYRPCTSDGVPCAWPLPALITDAVALARHVLDHPDAARGRGEREHAAYLERERLAQHLIGGLETARPAEAK